MVSYTITRYWSRDKYNHGFIVDDTYKSMGGST